MTHDPWKYVFASVRGTSHAVSDAPCQDSGVCRVLEAADGSEVLVAVASDGAGSAQRGEVGSALACSLFACELEALLGDGRTVRDVTREFARDWLTYFRHRVEALAESEELTPRDYACTFLAAVVGADCAAFMQVGDGAIVIPDRDGPDDYCWVFWPQQGQYANQTYFATEDDARDRLEHVLVEQRVDEVAVFTDGVQSLALHYESQTAHAPFFGPVFAWLRPAPGGHPEKLSASLTDYLDSPKVNERTDDDKTLILATRRAARESAINAEPHSDGHADADAAL